MCVGGGLRQHGPTQKSKKIKYIFKILFFLSARPCLKGGEAGAMFVWPGL